MHKGASSVSAVNEAAPRVKKSMFGLDKGRAFQNEIKALTPKP